MDVRVNFLKDWDTFVEISVHVGGMVNPLTDLVPTPCSRTFFPPPASLASVLAGVGGLWLKKIMTRKAPHLWHWICHLNHPYIINLTIDKKFQGKNIPICFAFKGLLIKKKQRSSIKQDFNFSISSKNFRDNSSQGF